MSVAPFILYGCDQPGCSFNSPTLSALHTHTVAEHAADPTPWEH